MSDSYSVCLNCVKRFPFTSLYPCSRTDVGKSAASELRNSLCTTCKWYQAAANEPHPILHISVRPLITGEMLDYSGSSILCHYLLSNFLFFLQKRCFMRITQITFSDTMWRLSSFSAIVSVVMSPGMWQADRAFIYRYTLRFISHFSQPFLHFVLLLTREPK